MNIVVLITLALATATTGWSMPKENDIEWQKVDEALASGPQCRHAHCHNVCLRRKHENFFAPSGVYTEKTIFNKPVQVYCDMETKGGGYTFINPTNLAQINGDELSDMFTARDSFLFCYRMFNGSQYCAVLSQLPQYKDIKLKLGLTENDGYNYPFNLCDLKVPYLYFGFLPKSVAANRNVQGFQINGENFDFVNCDGNSYSNIVLFPNYEGLEPSSFQLGHVWPRCSEIFSRCTPRSVDQYLPEHFFMFGEFSIGGCGCYTQSDRFPGAAGIAIGFK